MRLARRGHRAQNTDSRYVHKDGRIVMLSWMGTWSEPVRRYFFVGRDMTESRLAQETLRESEQLARGIIDTALDAFVQIDESGSILNWNSQAEKIFGWPRKDALGKNFIELIIAEPERGVLKAALDRFVRSGQGQILGNRREIRALRRDGKDFPAELSVTALRRREGILFNGFFRDLTDKIAAEDRIRQSEKMEAIGQLTGGIAHDFNNMLTVIIGNHRDPGGRGRDRSRDDAAIPRHDRRRCAAPRARDLTQRLLAFARSSRWQPRERRHQHARRRHRRAAAADARRADRDRDRARRRAVARARRRSATSWRRAPQPRHQRARRHARRRQAHPSRPVMPSSTTATPRRTAMSTPGQYVWWRSSDTGTGIPRRDPRQGLRAVLHHQGAGKGTGLGLSMVYGFVKQSGGHIKIYSEVGHGTTIKLYLPPRHRSPASPPKSPTRKRSKAAHETILVVEDDSWCETIVLTQLHSLGYVTLDAAECGGSAGHRRGRQRIRPAVHRRHHAGRHERSPARRRARNAASPG